MRYLIELSGESATLAIAESLAVAHSSRDTPGYESDGRALVLNSDISSEELVSRLALAWSVSQHLFSCDIGELDSMIGGLELPGETFRVRTSRLGDQHPPGNGTALARHVGEILSARYKVDLEKPDVEIRILMSERIHVGMLNGEIDRSSLEARKPENRPFKHPISLHPKLARTLVNLTGIRPNQTIFDPFCGTGGIILEAGIMGCRVLGGDMDARMVAGTMQNLEHFGIEGDIRQADVSIWPESHEPVDAIATDPPYGRSASTAKEPIESLYARAFGACHWMLKDGGKLAIALPGEKHITLAKDFELEGMYPVRVHKSLTRYFCVFSKLPAPKVAGVCCQGWKFTIISCMPDLSKPDDFDLI
ncbi:MAG: RsmD family RNA methyltransferase [Candidatus Thermoplasmatota archaeon]|nr:RsmD family RNA methyltransferase [Candidatus Thermoplasmatota archaeon]